MSRVARASCALLLICSTSLAQEPPLTADEVREAGTELRNENEELEALAATQDVIDLNSALEFLETSHGLRFLKDLNLEPKLFDREDGESTLGFAYDYSKSWNRWKKSGKRKDWGVDVEFAAKGNVAFERELNPEDFLDTRFRFSGYRNAGGVGTSSTLALAQELNELEDIAVQIEDGDELASSEAAQKLDSIQRGMLSNQTYLDLALHAGLESNQTFSQKHFTYGAELGVVYWPWEQGSLGSTLNVFDYPFAFLRLLTAYDEDFRLRGASMPSLLLGLDQVEPSGDDPRAEVGDDSDFARFRGELAFRTPVAEIGATQGSTNSRDAGKAGGVTLYFDAKWRFYKELGASDAVDDAGLDQFDHLELALRSSNGIFASFTDGQLPFDAEDEESLQIGFALGL